MRELVLNHASIAATDQQTAVEWLKAIAYGMAELVNHDVASKSLRMSRTEYEIRCVGDWSLGDAFQALKQQGFRDEFNFLRRLSLKSPLLSGVAEDVKQDFLGCEAVGCDYTKLSLEDGEPLLFCAISDAIAVGFPYHPVWDNDEVKVDFEELLIDERIIIASEIIDNLTRYNHATLISNRHHNRPVVRDYSDGVVLWRALGEDFPNLKFGPDVEICLYELNPSLINTVANNLSSLDIATARWQIDGGTMPQWGSNVTPESESVMRTPKLRDARRFRSRKGSNELFMWHARYGYSGRIHLRFDASTYEVEIGYIGPHLPL